MFLLNGFNLDNIFHDQKKAKKVEWEPAVFWLPARTESKKILSGKSNLQAFLVCKSRKGIKGEFLALSLWAETIEAMVMILVWTKSFSRALISSIPSGEVTFAFQVQRIDRSFTFVVDTLIREGCSKLASQHCVVICQRSTENNTRKRVLSSSFFLFPIASHTHKLIKVSLVLSFSNTNKWECMHQGSSLKPGLCTSSPSTQLTRMNDENGYVE